MVCAAEGEEQGERRRVRMRVRQLNSSSCSAERRDKYMATGHERSNPLHNFTLPCLKWANQRFLRCIKMSDEDDDVIGGAEGIGDRRSPGLKLENSAPTRRKEMENRGIEIGTGKESERRMTSTRLRITKRRIVEDDDHGDGENGKDGGIEALREKCIFDLKTAANKMKDAILREEAAGEVEEEDVMEKEQQPHQVRHKPVVDAVGAKTEVNEVRPWNLRTRRADCKSPIGVGIGTGSNSANGKGWKIEAKKQNCSPLRTESSMEKTERPKFSLSVSKKEIEEDFMKMVGHRPPRRPKKRPRNVQKQLDPLFPGMWLTDVSADSYKVPDAPENGKMNYLKHDEQLSF